MDGRCAFSGIEGGRRLVRPACIAGAGWLGYEAGRPWPVDIAADLKAPVLGLYGELDRGIPLDSVERMRAALAANGNPTGSEIVVFPGVGHGFHADYRESYNAAAATDGWAAYARLVPQARRGLMADENGGALSERRRPHASPRRFAY